MKIHGHPQKTEYKDKSEWITLSTQGHVTFGQPVPIDIGSMDSRHVHLDVTFPIYCENAGEKIIGGRFTIKTFHVDGFVQGIFGELLEDVIWDDTGTSTPPNMVGDPAVMGLKQWSGSFTINPKAGVGTNFIFGPHGWCAARIAVRTSYNGGGRSDVEQWLPVFSIQDITKPEAPVRSGAKVILESQVDIVVPDSAIKPGENGSSLFGTNVVEYYDYIPLAPISEPWLVPCAFYSYSALQDGPPAFLEQRLDPDLHNMIPGTIIVHKEIPQAFAGPIVTLKFDPVVMGTGVHKEMNQWTQARPDRNAQMSVLSVINVPVGAGVSPPVKVIIPDIVSDTQSEATAEIIGAGLLVGTISEMNDQNIPKGNVISQFPTAGSLVAPKSTVNFMLSSGAVTTPNEVWIPAVPTFMQLHINGVPQKRWQICGVDDSQTMDDCIELETKPE